MRRRRDKAHLERPRTDGSGGPRGARRHGEGVRPDRHVSATVRDAKGITPSMVNKANGNHGVVCFGDLPFTPASIQVTAVPRYGLAAHNDITVSGMIQGGATGCPGLGTDSTMGFVTSWNGSGGHRRSCAVRRRRPRLVRVTTRPAARVAGR